MSVVSSLVLDCVDPPKSSWGLPVEPFFLPVSVFFGWHLFLSFAAMGSRPSSAFARCGGVRGEITTSRGMISARESTEQVLFVEPYWRLVPSSIIARMFGGDGGGSRS